MVTLRIARQLAALKRGIVKYLLAATWHEANVPRSQEIVLLEFLKNLMVE